MADNDSVAKPTLETTFCGIKCVNPFWLASAPPSNCSEQVMRAFDAGWGGAVWKTIGEPITNVSSRYSSIDWDGRRMMGLNNIELISDRPIEINLVEIAEVKRRYPNHAVIASLMVESRREAWHEIVQRAEETVERGRQARLRIGKKIVDLRGEIAECRKTALRAGRVAHLARQERVVKPAHTLHVDAGADPRIAEAIGRARAEHRLLARVTRRVDVRDVVTGRVQRELGSQQA